MRSLYGNVNRRFRTLDTSHVRSMSQVPAPPPPEPPPQKPKRLRVSRGHVHNVLKDLKKVRRARVTGKPPRGAKRKSLETIVMFDLK